ncbi:RHS repeat-associated protein [Marinilabilia salmonicolor]|uniref:RHS repeat-associated protein n=2 Tax=Marinilabilia salmonicolor TaxID=989 RepID=A0A368UQM8_9BACT|nr:RHS repeat-associated protein [Marinilabilia salmonicolor]
MLAENAQIGGANNKYRYNGKELQEDKIGNGELEWYDYGARMYDAAIGRFHPQDRFSEKYYSLSNYQYAANNPVLFIDINGDSLQVTTDAIMAIYHGLDDDTNVKFEVNNGVINPDSFKEQAAESDDIVLKDVYEIASHERMVEMSVAESYEFNDNDGNPHDSKDDLQRNFNTPQDFDTRNDRDVHRANIQFGLPTGKTFNGNTGRSLFPGNNSVTGANSTNGNIQIILNAKRNLNHQAVGAAHEFGHVVLYLRNLPHGHGQKGVNSFIRKRADTVSKRVGYDF